MVAYKWACACCDEPQFDLPTSWSVGPPASVLAIPEDERAARVKMNADVCIVDDRAFLIRGQLEIPIVGHPDRLIFGVWTSLSQASMGIICDTWDDADRARHGPFFGWLNSALPSFLDTLNLATHVHNRPPGTVPRIEIEPSDHPLSKAQREGVTMTWVIDLARALLRHDRPA